MADTLQTGNILSIFFAVILITAGLLNISLVHPVPGIAYLLIAWLYFPATNEALKSKFGFVIPAALKIMLAIAIMMFTLGVSDLGDMIDKL